MLAWTSSHRDTPVSDKPFLWAERGKKGGRQGNCHRGQWGQERQSDLKGPSMKTNCVNQGPQWGEFVDTQEPDCSQGCICQHHLWSTPGPISAILSPAIQTPCLHLLPGHIVRLCFPASFAVRWNHITKQWVLANGTCEEVIYTTSYPVPKYFQCNLPCSLFPVLPDINDELQGPKAWQSQKMEGTWIPGFLLGREPPKVVTLTRNICTEFLCEKLIFIALSHKNIAVCYRKFCQLWQYFKQLPSSSNTPLPGLSSLLIQLTPWGQAPHCKMPGYSKHSPPKGGWGPYNLPWQYDIKGGKGFTLIFVRITRTCLRFFLV